MRKKEEKKNKDNAEAQRTLRKKRGEEKPKRGTIYRAPTFLESVCGIRTGINGAGILKFNWLKALGRRTQEHRQKCLCHKNQFGAVW